MDKKNANLGNWFIDQLNVYQSANSDAQSIKQNFIIRQEEFELIINSMKVKKASDPIQHELILGRRGSGKSTLLKRIEIEICENEKLNKRFISINLAEEQAGVYRLFDLWEYVLDELRHKLTEQITLPDYSTFDDDQEYTHSLYTLIHGICKKHKKKIILLLDNFDRIVENFTDDGNLLRETLINYSDVQIIAGSTRMDEHFWQYDKPFYEFFRRHRLEALSRDEMQLLLLHWSDSLGISELRKFVLESPGKLENIRILTDGLPRTLQFFIQIVLQKTENTSYQYLKKVMDNVSPVYQERLNHLTPQLRKTVLEMAFIWEACGTKQLVSKTKMQSKLISANLKTLADKGIVDIIGTSKKQNLYRLSERFFNMWLIITQGNPAQKRKAKWLSIFLENWYDAADFKKLTEEHIKSLESKKTDWDKALIHSKALCQSRYISTAERDSIIKLTERLRERTIGSNLLELPRKFAEMSVEIGKAFNTENYNQAIKLLEEIENEEDGVKFYGLGLAYFEKSNLSKAKFYYLLAISKENTKAFFALAVLYTVQEEFEIAEKYYLMAIDKGDTEAMHNLAYMYQNQGKLEQAKEYYLMAIGEGSSRSMNNLGSILLKQGEFEKGEGYFLMAIEKEDSGAMNNLALTYYLNNLLKEKSLDLIRKRNELQIDYIGKGLQILFEIWNGVFDNIEQRTSDILIATMGKDMEFFLLELLNQKQKNLVLRLFENPEIGEMLKEKYLVVYYVAQLLSKKEEENLELKIPPELVSTVDEVLASVKERQAFYGYV